MKNIILQHWTGELGPLELASKANMEKYAKQCGAEYELILGNQFHPKLHGCYQKLIMLDKRFDKYQDTLMVDLDMFVVKDVKDNVFAVPGVGLNSKVQKDIFKAKKLCPEAIIIPPRMSLYKHISNLIFKKFYRLTPLVETIAFDEISQLISFI